MIHSLIYRVEHSTAEYFLKNTLAPKSYKKIMEETREIQKKMKETFGLGLKPKNKVRYTLWGVRSVGMFSFVFFVKFQLPIGLHNSCTISPITGGTCSNCLTKRYD